MQPIEVDKIIITSRIRDFRRDRSVTQEELAEAVGVSRQSIISVESGRCLPSVPLAAALARFFEEPIEALFELQAKEESMTRELGSFKRVGSLHEAIDSMVNDAFMPMRTSINALPQMDIYQNEQELVVEADVPGLTEEDVDIEIQDGVLTIKGERKEEKEEKAKEYFHREVSYGSFQRALTLPVDVVPEKAKATVKNGHLKVVLPRVEQQLPKVHKLRAEKGQ